MEWTDIRLTVPRPAADGAVAVATAVAGDGIYIEDYADLEQQVQAIAHVDLIEQDLLDKPRDQVTVHLYVSPDDDAAAVVNTLQSKMLAAGLEHTITTGGIEQQDWENAWKQYYHTIEVGSHLAVVPSWEEYKGGRTVLRLDPGMAFGTGTHETTLLCLEVLDERVRGNERLLDIGTGSGILAVAALLLGAREATGIDIDPMCVRTAGENAARNGVQDRLAVCAGDLASGTEGQYDIITANIVADAIIRLAPDVPSRLAPDGLFVASGIIDEREAGVCAALSAAGLRINEVRRLNGWVAVLASSETGL